MNDQRSESGAAAPPTWPPPPPPLFGPPPTTRGAKRRRNTALLPAAIAVVLIVGVGIGVSVGLLTRGTPSASASGTSPGSGTNGVAVAQARALYEQALAAMRSSAGFHYVADSGGVGPAQTIVGDAGRSGGRQDITIGATAGQEQFTLILAGGVVYFQGNVGALEDQLGVPAAGAPGLQGKWVSVSNQDGPYSLVAPGITIADQVQETALTPTSATAIGAGGGRATRIRGSVPAQAAGGPGGTGHLDVAASSHLPLSYVSTLSVSGATATTTTTFSRWGTASAPAPPGGAVAWSTLGASAPPGGYGSGGAGLTPAPTPQI
jgi:hypothetical protein